MKLTENYRITAVRLVEFHNLGTTTVDLPEGGHLFLLGDNGSGKTTLLDAIHLVLSAGREMEFNSAARVAGARDSGGRTIQGIVLRYNAVTGRTSRESGITYAAIEFRDAASGKVISLSIGLSADGLDVAYQSWGAMAPVPVRELPLTIEEDGRLRASTQIEFKRLIQNIKGGKAFAHISDYRSAVAARLFGGEAKYADVCKLLRTGKAYREIAARATNYDELFRQLLEEPSRETFEPLLRGLRELDESKARLDQIDERAKYLEALRRRRDQLSLSRLRQSIVDWAKADSERVQADRELAGLRDAIAAADREFTALETAVHEAHASTIRVRARLDDLRHKDATGLIGREKALRDRVADCKRRLDDEVMRLKRESSEKEKAFAVQARSLASCREAMKSKGEKIQKMSRATGVPSGELVDALLCAEPVSSFDSCEKAFDCVASELSQARERCVAESIAARNKADEAEKSTAAAEAALEELRSRSDSLPELKGFAGIQMKVRENLLGARSIYELIEPVPGCDARRLALLERLCGEDFLATFVVDAKESDRLRSLIWKENGAWALAVREDCDCDVPALTPWLGSIISFEESDPAAVRLLSRHLASAHAPKDGEFLSLRTWSFRNRSALYEKLQPRLIGRKARESELIRMRREAELSLASAQRNQKMAEKLARQAEAATQSVREFETFVLEARGEIREENKAVVSATSKLHLAEEMSARTESIVVERQRELAHEMDALEDLQLQMRAEGIDETLERRLASAERAVRQMEAAEQSLQQKIGETRVRREDLLRSSEEQNAKINDFLAQAKLAASAFAGQLQPGESISDGVARLYPDCATESPDFAALREQCVGDARVAATEIERMIREPAGEAFAFSFDAGANHIADRRGSGLDAVMTEETRRLEELRGAINQKSREVFERIFMGEVMRNLYFDLKRLEDLSSRIQNKLGGRRFGMNRYAFALSQVPAYEGFVNLVRKGYLLDSGEGKDDLREYLDEHREEILNVEVDQIPDIFDYRRWFRFQLKVLTENEEGRVIDRQVKSLGSGGEQAVPNYLLILAVAEFLYHGGNRSDPPKSAPLLFDEAFYGIDAMRRDQLLAFADDLGLQLFVSSPDQDGVKREIRHSVSLIVIKDENFDVHLSPIVWKNDATQLSFLEKESVGPGMTVLGETR